MAASSVFRAMRAVGSACSCPAHWTPTVASAAPRVGTRCSHVDGAEDTDYAFEMATSTVRVGPGVTKEIGHDVKRSGAKRVCLVSDKNVINLPSVKNLALKSLEDQNVDYEVFDDVRVEPTDLSLKTAIEFARKNDFDYYIAVGGGSVMDTCKVMNLFGSDRDAELLDYVNAPIGKAQGVSVPLSPLIAVPTTSGTGSETTGVSIFDYTPMGAKTGIGHRALRPTLGLVDPIHTYSLPQNVAAFSGFDVLCHALESYTAIPYNQRSPRPADPFDRPAYQGSNPISDIWSMVGLDYCGKYLKRSIQNPDDIEARTMMHFASTYAGIGFGNAGVHLCHGLSYPISGNVRTYQASGYSDDHPIVPHGLSVIITSPSVFEFTAPACPDRHLEAARVLGANVIGASAADGGKILADTLRAFMQDLGVANGLNGLGFTTDDIPALVEGALPQKRVTKLSPNPVDRDSIARIYENSMTNY